MKNIVLIGFKKCGKTTIGKLLARKLGKRFIDTDCLIEKLYFQTHQTKKSSFEIYRDHLEDFFRKLEMQAIHSIEEEKGMVIATGGGSLLTLENAQALKKNGFLVFLDASKDLLLKRMEKTASFLSENPIDSLFEKRRKRSLQWADFRIETDKKSKEEILEEITGEFYGKQ